MKRTQPFVFLLILCIIGSMACTTDNHPGSEDAGTVNNGNGGNTAVDREANRLRVRVGSRTFLATLRNNATVTAFRTRLPLTLSMKELNGNEKFAQLSDALPTNASSPGTIQTGDLMLYGSNTLVLFYETFPTSYSYTKLGQIDNPTGLAAALGSGNVTVSFEGE